MGHVVMQVAVPQVPEREVANTGEMRLQQRIGMGDEGDDLRNGHRDIVLHIASGTLLRFAHVLPSQPWFALLELSDNHGETHAREAFETVLGEAFEQALLADALIAESLAQSEALWLLRENMIAGPREIARATTPGNRR